jgi:hypothetical protein
MKKLLIVTLSLFSITLSIGAQEKEPLAVTKEVDDSYKASGNAEWFSDQDLWQHFHFKAELEKLTYQSLDKEFELAWSLEIGNADKFDYEYLLSYTHSYDRQTDIFTGETVRSTDVIISQDFDINRIKGRLGLTTHFGMNRVKENNAYLIKYNAEASPLGIKYDLHESDNVTELSLSYLPAYFYSEYYDAAGSKFIDQALLHVIKLSFSATNKTFTFSNEVAYKMVKPFDESKKIDSDYMASNDLTISYNVSAAFTLSYNSLLTVNKRRQSFQNLPSTDHRHGLSFSFVWN